MFVAPVVVEHHMHLKLLRHVAIDLAQESQELLGPTLVSAL
jgi:hypothetical protein